MRAILMSTIASTAGAVVLASAPASEAAASYLVAPARASVPVGSPGETFFSDDFYVVTPDANVTLSGSPDGTASFWVDDILQLDITHEDGSHATYHADDSNGCTADTVLTTPATSLAPYLKPGTNRIQVTFRDTCGGNDGNTAIYLSGNLAIKRSLSFLDAGTFVGFFDGGEGCTTGFGAHTPAGSKYELGAAHCVNGAVTANHAMLVTNLIRGSSGAGNIVFADGLRCPSPQCLLAQPANENTDFFAWQPDSAIPTNRVQTPHGLLPVLGTKSINTLFGGETICHYGDGSNGEQCGQAYSSTGEKAVCAVIRVCGGANKGLLVEPMVSHPGDSGGPVYIYNGKKTGVYAVGIDIDQDLTYCATKNHCIGLSFIHPVGDVLANLGLILNT